MNPEPHVAIDYLTPRWRAHKRREEHRRTTTSPRNGVRAREGALTNWHTCNSSARETLPRRQTRVQNHPQSSSGPVSVPAAADADTRTAGSPAPRSLTSCATWSRVRRSGARRSTSGARATGWERNASRGRRSKRPEQPRQQKLGQEPQPAEQRRRGERRVQQGLGQRGNQVQSVSPDSERGSYETRRYSVPWKLPSKSSPKELAMGLGTKPSIS